MEKTQFPADFKDFLKLLNEAQARYLVIGGWAVVKHGYPRYTGDFDIWIPMDPANSEIIRKVMLKFIRMAPTPDEMMTPKKIFRMGVVPNRLEVTNHIDGVEFETCYPARQMLAFDGIVAPVIGMDDLIKNKLASARLKDLNDVQYLRKMRKKSRRGKK